MSKGPWGIDELPQASFLFREDSEPLLCLIGLDDVADICAVVRGNTRLTLNRALSEHLEKSMSVAVHLK
jgi:hypothetical protein